MPPTATVIMEEGIISMGTILVGIISEGIISAGTTANTTRGLRSRKSKGLTPVCRITHGILKSRL